MGHTAVEDVPGAIEVQAGSIVSKVIFRDETLNVTVFGIDEGEGLTEHTASRTAIVEVMSGRLELSVGGEAHEAGPASGCAWRRAPRMRSSRGSRR